MSGLRARGHGCLLLAPEGPLLEQARALGVPIVATAVGGVPDVVEDGATGRLVPERDAEALARALLETLDRPEERRQWAARARGSVRRFSVEQLVERTLAQYELALRARAPRA